VSTATNSPISHGRGARDEATVFGSFMLRAAHKSEQRAEHMLLGALQLLKEH
jgi:hypothetical protein